MEERHQEEDTTQSEPALPTWSPAFRKTLPRWEWALLVFDVEGITYLPVSRTWAHVPVAAALILLAPFAGVAAFVNPTGGLVLAFLAVCVAAVILALVQAPGQKRALTQKEAARNEGVGSIEPESGTWRLPWEQIAEVSVTPWRQAARLTVTESDGSSVHIVLGWLSPMGKLLGDFGDREAIAKAAADAVRSHAPGKLRE